MASGRWSVEELRPLVERWDERVRADVSRFDLAVPEVVAGGSVLRGPASEEQVRDAERRLGVGLPTSYRSFLLISNGAYASSLGVELDGQARHGFLASEDVALAAQADAGHVRLWTGMAELNDPANDAPSAGDDPAEVRYYAALARGVLISRPSGPFRDVLVPREGLDEWEAWSFSHDGAAAHRSFADLLRWHAERPTEQPLKSDADALVGRVREGFLPALGDLAELGDPRTGDLAREVLDDDSFLEILVEAHARELKRQWGDDLLPDRARDVRIADSDRIQRASHVLGQLREEASIPALRRAYQRALSAQERIEALDALCACGAPDAAQLLERASRGPDERLRDWASWRLSQAG